MPLTRLLAPLVPLALVAVALAGCSDDDQTEAVQAVCDAQQEVETAVANLASFDPATMSTNDLQSDVAAIQSAVSDLVSARSDLSAEVVDSVQQAWDDLSGELQSLADEPMSEVPAEAAADVQAAVSEFRSSWSQAVADADC